MPEITVFAWCYRPFVMGGPTGRHIKTSLPGEGPHDLGKGYTGYVVRSPWGLELVAEATSGGIVGPSLESVRADVEAGDAVFMAKQIKAAKEKVATAVYMSPDDFWGGWDKNVDADSVFSAVAPRLHVCGGG